MREETVRQIVAAVSDKLPQEKLVLLKNKLAEAPDSVADEILCTPLHNSVTVILLSVFLGGLGVDRFVIGDVGLGVAKLLLGWITFGIWPLIDIFFCYKKAKEKNFNKLMSIL